MTSNCYSAYKIQQVILIGLHSVPWQAVGRCVTEDISFTQPIAANGDGSKQAWRQTQGLEGRGGEGRGRSAHAEKYLTNNSYKTEWKPNRVQSKHHLNYYNWMDNETLGAGQQLAPNQHGVPGFRSQSELLQQLSEVGGLGELSVDPGQLVQDGTVQGHTGHLPLCTAATVLTDLDTNTHRNILLRLPYIWHFLYLHCRITTSWLFAFSNHSSYSLQPCLTRLK